MPESTGDDLNVILPAEWEQLKQLYQLFHDVLWSKEVSIDKKLTQEEGFELMRRFQDLNPKRNPKVVEHYRSILKAAISQGQEKVQQVNPDKAGMGEAYFFAACVAVGHSDIAQEKKDAIIDGFIRKARKLGVQSPLIELEAQSPLIE